MTQPSKPWIDEVTGILEAQTERAAYLTKFLFKIVPFSVVLGLLTCATVVHFWGWMEFSRMILQVVLTLTLGATLFAGILKRLDKALSDESDGTKGKGL